MGLPAKCSQRVQSAFYKAFYNWGSFVGRKPKLVIFASTVLCVLGAIRLPLAIAFPLESVVEQDQLWVPQEAQAITDKNKYDAAFSTTYRRNVLYFTTKPAGGNILTSDFLKEVRRFELMVNEQLYATHFGNSGPSRGGSYPELDLNDASVSASGISVSYDDVCAQADPSSGARNLAEPSSGEVGGGASRCVSFGHPLELCYRSGDRGGSYDFETQSLTPAEISARVDSGRGVDESLFPAGGRTANTGSIFGGISRDADGKVTGAKAMAFSYLLAQANESSAGNGGAKDAAEAWEDQLNMLVGKKWCNDPPQSLGAVNPDDDAVPLVWSSDTVEIFPQTAGATSRELGKAIRGDLVALQVGFMIILVYAIFIFWKYDPVHSRALLAVAGCCSVGLSIGFAYGFSTGIGLKLNPVINVLPFILIGIGIDDMFVLVAALESESADLDPKERMARAMAKAGVSITITSFTDAMAFVLGTASQLPALSTFCGFAAIGIAADFLLQISFFAGFMALDARREALRKTDCCPCCCSAPLPEEVKYGCCCCPCTHAATGTPKEGAFLKRIIVNYYIPLLRKPAIKAAVLVFFAALTAVMAWSASNLKQDFQFRWFVGSDAALQQAFDVQDDYFASTGLPVSTVTPSTVAWDYTSVANQQKLVALGTAINGVKWIETGSLNAWYPTLREWVYECGQEASVTTGPLASATSPCVRRDCLRKGSTSLLYPHCSHRKYDRDTTGAVKTDAGGHAVPGAAAKKYLVTADGVTAATATTALEECFLPPTEFYAYLDQFLADAALGAALFGSDLVWASESNVRTDADVARGLTASRLRASYKATDEADQQVESMRDLRSAVASVDIGGAFPYMFMFLYYEQYAIIEREALTNLGLALVAVFVIVTLFVASLGATLLVMLCVVLVDVDILGLMWLWGLSIDSVAIINLVLAVGLAVDYSCHVAHSFVQMPATPGLSPRAQRQERTDRAVEEMGVAVVHGAVSTFLAVLILSTSKSYIFVIFFKQFFGICLFGALHGLLLLPVLLSLVGPDPVDVGAHKPAATDGGATKGDNGHALEMGAAKGA